MNDPDTIGVLLFDVARRVCLMIYRAVAHHMGSHIHREGEATARSEGSRFRQVGEALGTKYWKSGHRRHRRLVRRDVFLLPVRPANHRI